MKLALSLSLVVAMTVSVRSADELIVEPPLPDVAVLQSTFTDDICGVSNVVASHNGAVLTGTRVFARCGWADSHIVLGGGCGYKHLPNGGASTIPPMGPSVPSADAIGPGWLCIAPSGVEQFAGDKGQLEAWAICGIKC